jgi:amino acid transporter
MSAAPDGARPVASPPVLARSMRSFGALLITLSALSPSIGLFIVGDELLHQAGTATFLCFVAAGLLGVAMASVYAELSSAFPHTGAEYTIVGRVLGPAAGFGMLGLTLSGFTIAQALSAQAMVGYLQALDPALPLKPTALVIVAVVTLIGVLNIRLNALVTGLCLAVELLALVLVAVIGFAHPQRDVISAVIHPVMQGASGLVPTPLLVMGVAAIGSIYAFNGYGSAVYLGEEMQDAPKRMARVIFAALGVAALTMLPPLLAILVGAPDLRALVSAKHPVTAFMEAAGGPGLAKAMAAGVALAFFNCMIAVALMAGRLLYATARDRVWPEALNSAFVRLHPRFNSPWIGTLVMGAVSLAWCFAPKGWLLIVIASGNVGFYAALCLAAIKGRLTGSTAHAGWRMPLFPLAPVLGLLALGAVVWAAAMEPKRGQAGLIALVVVLAVSALWYWLVLKPKGRWAHRGPDEA